MRRVIYYLVFVCVFCAFGFSQNAQKFAHINTSLLLQAMPEVAEADKKLAAIQKDYESILQTMTVEYQRKVENFQNTQSTMSEVIRNTTIGEIQDLERRIGEFQQKAQRELQQKQLELYDPIKKKAADAIAAVAKEKGYSYVFDVSQPVNVVYFESGIDILEEVKSKLSL